MNDLVDRFAAGLGAGGALGLAVSGGGDSMAMLHLAVAAGLRPRVVTVDHGLRPGSAAEARMVGDVAQGLGLRHDTLRWQGWDNRGNLQAEARKARRRLIGAWAQQHGIARVALAHTQNDVAETFLMRLSRGAGVDGLSAMAPRWSQDGLLWLRPMLGMARDDLRAWLLARGLQWVEDPSNDSLRFERVRSRKALSVLAPIGLGAERLSEVAHHLAEARVALDRLADDWAARVLEVQSGTVAISSRLWDAPAETQRRLIQRVVMWIAPAEYAPRGQRIGELVARLSAGQAATLAGCRFLGTGDGLRAFREARAVAPRVAADQLWDGRWRLKGHPPDQAELGALGAEGLALCPDWRGRGLPRAAQLSLPALWVGQTLVSAPFAGFADTLYGVVSPLAPIGHDSATLSH